MNLKILVVCENFDNGGLETQIKTYYENLPQNVEMVFAFSKYTEAVLLNNAKIYVGFHFSYADTIKDFCSDVNRLVNIIHKEKIDVVHVHPYYSFFSAVIASQITNTKLFYSFHGISSFNFLKTVTSTALFQYAFECNAIANVFSVSNDGMMCFKNLNYKNVSLLPNAISLNKFPEAKIIENGRWALISRIDSDKISEIKLLIKNKGKYSIKTLDIYGSGTACDELKEFISAEGCEENVKLLGYCNNLYETLNGKYNGVIGIGRVLLESLAMGFPTILIGYNKVSGYVNYEVFTEIKNNNFSNIKLEVENLDFPSSSEVEMIQKEIRNNYNIENIILNYLDDINNKKSNFMQNLKDMYKEIEILNNNDQLSNCSFHKERLIYDLIYKFIGKFTLRAEISNLFANADLSYELYDIITLRMLEMKGMIGNE